MALLQARGDGDLPHPRADGRQPRGRARRLLAYFGKEPKHLSAAEAALLVAIPQSPSRRRPERAPAVAQVARDVVLRAG
jgi:membrane carboxypeptidase/penicillin-binding protein PbpC